MNIRILLQIILITPMTYGLSLAKSFLHKNRWCCANPKSWGTTPLLGPLCYKLITIVNCYLEADLTCFVYCPKALYLIIFIVWHPF